MRFAGSTPAVEAMGLFSGYDPGMIGSIAQKGRSLQKQTDMKAEAAIKSTENEAQAMIDAAEYGASATRAQGQAAGMSSMVSGIASGISAFAGPIASGMNSGGGGYVTPGGIDTGMAKSNFAPTQLGVNHFNLSTGIPGVNR